MADKYITPRITYTSPIRGFGADANPGTLTIRDTTLSTELIMISTGGYAYQKKVPEIQESRNYDLNITVDWPSKTFMDHYNAGKIFLSGVALNGVSSLGIQFGSTELTERSRVITNGRVSRLVLTMVVIGVGNGAEFKFSLRSRQDTNLEFVAPEVYWTVDLNSYVLNLFARVQLTLVGGGGGGGSSSWAPFWDGNGTTGSSALAFVQNRPDPAVGISSGNTVARFEALGGGGGGTGSWGNGSSFNNGAPGVGGGYSYDAARIGEWFTSGQGNGATGQVYGLAGLSATSQSRWGTQRGAVNANIPEAGWGGDGATGIGDERWAYGGAGGAGGQFIMDRLYAPKTNSIGMLGLANFPHPGYKSNNGINKGTDGGYGKIQVTITDNLSSRTFIWSPGGSKP